GGSNTLGDTMPRSDAERLVRTIASGATAAAGVNVEDVMPVRDAVPLVTTREPARAQRTAPPIPLPEQPPAHMSPSGLALIGANLVPLAGVLFFGWDLSSVMVLFWAESGVIGFYTALKMAI